MRHGQRQTDGIAGEQTKSQDRQLAVRRYLDDIEYAHERGLHFDAEKSLQFVETVCTNQKAEWAGQPFELSPNQHFMLWALNCSRTCVVLTCFTGFSAIAPPNICQSADGL